MTINHPLRRRRGAVLMAATVAATGVLLAPAAAFADATGEFENDGFIYPPANGSHLTDSAASGGAAVAMWGTTSNDIVLATGDVTTTAFRIRAKQAACGPAAAQMAVKVNGVAAGTVTVSATTWTDYTVTGTWTGDWPLVHIDFLNSYEGTCRQLHLDRITAVTGTTYYVDPAGSNSNNGTSPSSAWKTVAEVNARTLVPGDTVLFKRGQTFTGTGLTADTARITYGAYGDENGALPVLDANRGASHVIDVSAPGVVVQDLQVQKGGAGDQVGISVTAADVIVRRVIATDNAIGVQADDGADRLRVTESVLRDNTMVIQPGGGNDDYGACGVSVLAADGVQIDHNTFSGNVGDSDDFGQDGSAVELYGGTNTTVHHNTAVDNHTFSELGNDGTNNTHFYDNVITTTVSGPEDAYGFNVQGTGDFGGVDNTIITNNTIVMLSLRAGPLSTGLEPGVVQFHNNVVQAVNAGHNEAAIDEGHNVYYGHNYTGIKSIHSAGGTTAAPSSVEADPKFESSDNLRLRSGSPALNRGIDAYGVTTDWDGDARWIGPGVDAGAYERQTA
ncbi:carbohydrate-binding domain-containing protein [Actinoplanes solisilvae]|uniref:carbohydrate-binding domain-containing protein n=1 Tax=Actinoplanes solisilvae TaxID=2486853 RepID=UPI000FDAFE51|nr:carbohydrate-binding domain-containing protein [Actinoplanes solisilvae]